MAALRVDSQRKEAMHSRAASVLALVLCFIASCARPASVETFVKADGSGVYDFEINMTDSLHVYDLSFYTRLDGGRAPSGFPMKVYLTSPSGQTYVENVYFDCSKGWISPYRTGLVPVEHGLWTMSVRAAADGMCGLGLVTELK